MSQNKYWQSFGEVKSGESFRQQNQDEFREELPFEEFDGELADAKAPRRDFLKYLGFSTAAATLAASCEIPVKKVIPYANKPENLIPGVAQYYATTFVQEGDVVPVLAKVRDGRPIKIEGNKLEGSAFAQGGTSARVQASVLDLYDMHRLRYPQQKKGDSFQEVPTYEQLDKTIAEQMKAAGGTTVLLTTTLNSPSTQAIINGYAGLKHVQYDAVSYSGMLLANEACGFGSKQLPSYDFAAADVIVSLGADFLGSWLSPVEFAKDYSVGRKIDAKNPRMSKHYQFEGYLSLTGASADERFVHRPSQTGSVALALLAALNGGPVELSDAKLKAGVEKVAADLNKNKGKGLVVCGSNDKNVQIVVNAINQAIGAYGATIDWKRPVNYRKGIDSEMNDLLTAMEAGQVGTLMIYGANPIYNYHDAARFAAAMKKVKVSISFNERMDETTEHCMFSIPSPHYLESWGDANPKTGVICFQQPTIHPLFKTRPFQTSLLKWSGNDTDYDVYFKNFWNAQPGGEAAFNEGLQNGVREEASEGKGPGNYSDVAVAGATAAIKAYAAVSGTEVVLYQKTSIGTGTGATNPWLQELPDGVSKATWDNYALMSMPMAKQLLGLDLIEGSEKEINNYEFYPQKPVVKITFGKKEIELPVIIVPGMQSNTIAVAVGYGRGEKLGKTAAGVGQNAYLLSSFDGTTVSYQGTVTLADAGRKHKVATTQVHGTYDDRTEVVRETTLATLVKYPNVIPDYRNHLEEAYGQGTDPNEFDFRKNATLYGQHGQPGIKWGMNIDMNACYGCGSCVVACHAENNVPVVGKSEVLRYHDMHWLRIDRYFVSDATNPDQLKGVVFQPMMCQHCDNAPCENVCPVAATNHSAEGINQMTYNRCIGTRYCANNCPFKVRRFNWADYTGADSFPNNRDQSLVGKLDPVVEQMNDDLTRMVLNPDVTVRSRGVIEKCSFCFQRLQAAKLEAKKQNRPLADGDAKTACQTACSANAIIFGNVHDEQSEIAQVRANNASRSYYVLEQLHVLPNVSYLAKVRNTDELIEPEMHHAAASEEHAPAKAGENAPAHH